MRVAEVGLESDLYRSMFCKGSEQNCPRRHPAEPIWCHQIAPDDSNVGFTPIQEAGDQVLAHIAQGAEKAIREAAVSDVGSQIESAMAGPLQTIDRALKKLEQSASTANLAADRWRMFTQVFRWQQLAIAVLAGILIGAVGHWYFVTRGPQTEATEYLLFLKHGIEQRQVQTTASSQGQKTGPLHRPKSKIRLDPAPDSSAPTPPTVLNDGWRTTACHMHMALILRMSKDGKILQTLLTALISW